MTPAEGSSTGASAARIFISYKRDVEPDCSLAQHLYDSLLGQGYRVFKDVEGIPTGADYSKLIEREIIASDFFIVLLSKASVAHDWVAAETVMAKNGADGAGHPRILPVRVAALEDLPLLFLATIGTLQYSTWRDAADNEKLLGELIAIVGTHAGAAASRLVRGVHFIITERLWGAGGGRESLEGTTIVPVLAGKETGLSATRGAGPGTFGIKVLAGGALEVAIWSGADYRRVQSRPRKFVTMLEADTHTWCFARYQLDQPVLLARPGRDPIVVTVDPAGAAAVWMITHRRLSLQERFLVVMRRT